MANTHLKLPLKCRQTEAYVVGFRVDGSVVTTSAAKTGLLEGANDALISKGSGATSNEVTITYDVPSLRVPVVLGIAALTTNCHVEIKSISTTALVYETFQVADGTTGVDDADVHISLMLFDSATVY